MNTKTVLTDEEIIMIGKQVEAIEQGENGYILPIAFSRAIEQAILQSPEIQALRKDAERYRWLRDAEELPFNLMKTEMIGATGG